MEEESIFYFIFLEDNSTMNPIQLIFLNVNLYDHTIFKLHFYKIY
jgi:hypothetical protein